MKKYIIIMQYDGSSFSGYQKQLNYRTVQGDLDFALFKLLGHKVNTTCSGRTDKGVHALQQVVSFKTDTRIPVEKMLNFLSSFLEEDIKILSLREGSRNPRRDARSRKYLYRIRPLSEKSVFNARYFSFYDIDVELFKETMNQFLGKHDFRYFSVSVPTHFNSIKTIFRISFENDLDIIIEGDSFLRGMVRAIIGTSIAVASGELPIDFIKQAFLNPNHTTIKKIATPNGLYLQEILY